MSFVQGHNAVMPARLKPTTPRSPVKHSTTEPLHSQYALMLFFSFMNLLFLFCLVFAMSLCTSVHMCFVVTCLERADLLALVCDV